MVMIANTAFVAAGLLGSFATQRVKMNKKAAEKIEMADVDSEAGTVGTAGVQTQGEIKGGVVADEKRGSFMGVESLNTTSRVEQT